MNKIKKIWQERDAQWEYIRWLFYYSRPYSGRIILMMLINMLNTVATLAMVQVSKVIIDQATLGNEFINFIVVYIIMMVAMLLLDVGAGLWATILNEKFSFGIRKQIYEKIIHSHWMSVKKFHTGDLMTRLTSDASTVADGIINTIPGILQLVIELILVFCTLYMYSPLLACLGLVVAPVAALSSWWLGRKLKKLQVKVQESEAQYRSFIQESLANLLIVKSFANEDYAAERLTELREERFYWVFRRVKMGAASSATISLTFQLGYIAAFCYGAMQIAEKAITYGTMSVFLTLVNRVQAPIIGLSQQIPRVVSILASAGRIMELQEIPLEEKEDENITVGRIGVRMKDVSFGYTEEKVLQNVNLEITPGEIVAIVGKSGIGKTTLIRLMMSFMNEMQGEISFYNEKGETEFANASTREFISYVPQGNTLFSGTIRENIRMGNLDATEEEMVEALKLASGYEFVMNLPNGIDTVIGERGHGLSEGQAQRIAIARALVRKAPFLILDEATSALDETTELAVLEGLKQLNPSPTCLIITHRRSILPYCDCEIQLQDKQCVRK